MVRIGVIGLGFMGRMHLESYMKMDGVEVVAVSDQDEKRASGDLSGGWGNMETEVDQLDMTRIRGTTDWRELLAYEEVDAVDICVPTPGHVEIATAAIDAGKHVLCEKPLAVTSQEAQVIADAANAGAEKGLVFMPAMCMRFWPGWRWLKDVIGEGKYGKLKGLQISRVGGAPGGWFADGELSGGALLDLHIHDTDFVSFLLGVPDGVYSRGYSVKSGKVDHVVTHYLYEDTPLVVAEGGWMSEEHPFSMGYTANFENATAEFRVGRDDALMVTQDGKTEAMAVPEEDGYVQEMAYFIKCVTNGEQPKVVTANDAVMSIKICEAEAKSVETGEVVRL